MNPTREYIEVISGRADDALGALFDEILAERVVKTVTASPDALALYIEGEDASDLFDGAVRVQFHSRRLALGDAAIVAAFLPADERDALLADIRRAVTEWIEKRELGERA